MNPNKPSLYLPCETRNREFEAKLLLACHAAERGWRGVVGAKKAIDQRIARLPRGLYISKSITRRNRFILDIGKRLGHIVTAWDEEGLVFASPEIYRATKVGATTLTIPDKLFAWGEANATAWRDHPAFNGTPISITGNPRADLLRPELRDYFADEARSLRRHHGDFILINTNFSLVNHFLPGKSLYRQMLQAKKQPISQYGSINGLASHKVKLFQHFIEMAQAVALRFPRHKLIIRPHPSENLDTWREIMASHSNVAIIYSGNVAAWLLATRALIHNGCTTGVESFLLERPAIAYQPVVSEDYDSQLPNTLSLRVSDLNTLYMHIDNLLQGNTSGQETLLKKCHAHACQHIASFDGKSACERILDSLEPTKSLLLDRKKPPLVDQIIGWTAAEYRRLFKRTQFVRRSTTDSTGYQQHIFPAVSQSQVETYLQRFSSLLNRFQDLQVDDLGDCIFALSKQ